MCSKQGAGPRREARESDKVDRHEPRLNAPQEETEMSKREGKQAYEAKAPRKAKGKGCWQETEDTGRPTKQSKGSRHTAKTFATAVCRS